MLTSAGGVLEVCWRCAGVAPLQHAPMSDPSSTTPTPLRHAPPGTLIAMSERSSTPSTPTLAALTLSAALNDLPQDVLVGVFLACATTSACRLARTCTRCTRRRGRRRGRRRRRAQSGSRSVNGNAHK